MTDLESQFAGTQDVLEKHRINVGNLQDYMSRHVDGFSGDIKLSQFKGGQSNPTYRIDAANHQANCCPPPMQWTGNIESLALWAKQTCQSQGLTAYVKTPRLSARHFTLWKWSRAASSGTAPCRA